MDYVLYYALHHARRPATEWLTGHGERGEREIKKSRLACCGRRLREKRMPCLAGGFRLHFHKPSIYTTY